MPAPDRSDSATAPRHTTRFYANRPFGSEAEFNPFSILINEGYDQLRTSTERPLFSQPYGIGAETVLRSLVHADRVLRNFGYRNWLRDEVFPLSLKSGGGGQWYPNYQLHLWGSGMTYARLIEWFEQHGAEQHPRLAAGATAMAFHFLNEVIENGGSRVDNEDALTDLLVFDTGSIILWNQDWITRVFSGSVEMTDWPGQASFGLPGKTIENAYSMVMLRVPLPRTADWKLLTTAGNAFLLGVSRRASGDYWISASGGFDPSDNPIIDPATGKKSVTLEANAGVFLDRDGSLLVSFITKGGSNNGPTLNVYPGVLRVGSASPGLWAQQIRGGGFRFGIVSRWGVGLSGRSSGK